MYRIYPISEETVKPHCGNLVCAIMHDGTRHYGILNRMECGQLILNEESPTVETLSALKRKSKSGVKSNRPNKTSNKVKAEIQAFGFGGGFGGGYPYGYGYGGGRLALDLAAIALLFAVLW